MNELPKNQETTKPNSNTNSSETWRKTNHIWIATQATINQKPHKTYSKTKGRAGGGVGGLNEFGMAISDSVTLEFWYFPTTQNIMSNFFWINATSMLMLIMSRPKDNHNEKQSSASTNFRSSWGCLEFLLLIFALLFGVYPSSICDANSCFSSTNSSHLAVYSLTWFASVVHFAKYQEHSPAIQWTDHTRYKVIDASQVFANFFNATLG